MKNYIKAALVTFLALLPTGAFLMLCYFYPVLLLYLLKITAGAIILFIILVIYIAAYVNVRDKED